MTKDRTSGHPKMTCRNWECGVLVLADDPPAAVSSEPAPSVHLAMASKMTSDGQVPGNSSLGIFEGVVPVPMQLPGEPLGQDGAKGPWFSQDL